MISHRLPNTQVVATGKTQILITTKKLKQGKLRKKIARITLGRRIINQDHLKWYFPRVSIDAPQTR